IMEGRETEYNFLDQLLESEMKQSLICDRFVKVFWAAIFIMILAFGGFKADQYMKNNEIIRIAAENQRTDGRVKELQSKMAAIPNFEMKLKKLQEIMENRNPGANEVLFALRKSAAKGVFVENIKMNENKIELVGTAETTDGVYEFQRNLLKEGFFNITSSPLNNAGQFYTFKIEANIK
ncbi:MAG: PilN domain-containing protein, partial [Fusobacteriaceae bacterium]